MLKSIRARVVALGAGGVFLLAVLVAGTAAAGDFLANAHFATRYIPQSPSGLPRNCTGMDCAYVNSTTHEFMFKNASGVHVPSAASASAVVSAGGYTNANVTVDAYGRVTSITNGLAPAGGGYTTTQNNASNLTQRSALNFKGAGVSCVDNSGSARTDCTWRPLGYIDATDATFGAKGDGIVDDTAAIQAALTAATTGSTVYVPAGTYKLTSSLTMSTAGVTLDLGRAVLNSSAANCIVVSASNVRIQGGTLNMLATGAAQFGINPSGTVANLVVEKVTLNGTGSTADAQTGFGNNSGQTLSGIRILNNVVTNMSVGISLNANLSGSLTDALVQGNRVTGSVGTSPGQGYGIHHANGSGNPSMVRIIGNYLESNQRHDIYQANGSGVSIIGNHTRNHRNGVCDGTDRPSITIGRSSDVIVADNVVENTCDAAFDIFTDTAGTTSNNVRIVNNVVRNWKNFPAVQIGDPAPATNGFPTDVVVSGNHFYTDLTVTSGSGSATASAIYLYSGKRVTVSDNSFYMTNSSSTSYIIDILGQSETAGTTLYNDDVRFVGNQAFGSGTGNTMFRLESAACGSNTRYDFWNNRVNATTVFNLAAAQTNPNIYVWQTPQGGLDATKVHALDANLYAGFQMASQASNPCPASTSCIYNDTNKSNVILSNAADGASAVGTISDTTVSLANATSKLLSVRNNTVEKMNVGFSGVLTTVGSIVSGFDLFTSAGGALRSAGGIAGSYRSVASTVTVAVTDFYVGVSGTGARTANLPAASTCKQAGQEITIQDVGNSAGAITINPNGADNINGANSAVTIAAAFGRRVFYCDKSTNWYTSGTF
jgi:hypothetical protein